MSKHLSKRRIEALLTAAGRGLDEIMYEMSDECGEEEYGGSFEDDVLTAMQIIRKRYLHASKGGGAPTAHSNLSADRSSDYD